jgi:hypothetical protein
MVEAVDAKADSLLSDSADATAVRVELIRIA